LTKKLRTISLRCSLSAFACVAKSRSSPRLSRKAGVSLGSLKRFEHDHQISLQSLIKLSIALGCESDFSELFSKKGYSSIQEVLDER